MLAAGFSVVLAFVSSAGLAVGGDSPGMAMTTPSRAAARDVGFETVSGAPVWSIPAVGATTTVQLGLRITNRSDQALRFTNFDTLVPALRDAHGRSIAIDGGRNRTLPPDVKNCPLLAPGESQVFHLDAKLYWHGGILRLGGTDGFGGLWYFSGLVPGLYELRMGYRQMHQQLTLGTPAARALRGFWIAEAAGSWVTVTIDDPQP